MKRELFFFGIAIAVIAVIMQWLDYTFITKSIGFEVYAVAIAGVFLMVGIVVTKKFIGTNSTDESVKTFEIAKKFELSSREEEVLKGICNGKSNREIAKDLFISESTVKTHVGNLFSKMGVKRRTQVIQMVQSAEIVSVH